ncbi:MAG: prolyl oligopeptidase family serine peptidase [Proteobacteria bacterium]|nr:prolyl oligopeptidase family serine peptidase [Pseudomonadota bacterium]
MRTLHRIAALLVLSVVSACGGSSHDNTSTMTPPPQRGDLVNGPPTLVASYAPSDLLGLLSGNDLGKLLLEQAYAPVCSVSVYHMEYETVDANGKLAVASGALMVPAGSASGCTGGRPVVLYAHGTNADKSFDISQVSASDNGEGLLLAAVFAAEGYIVVAPNYVGYDISTVDYHPYLVADQQSKDMIDALTAARAALPTAGEPNSTDGGKLFITGYSEGGYVAMATHSAMQTAGMTVTASGPMSGPYTLSALGDAIFEGQVNDSAPENLALLVVGYQKAYGDVYSAPADAFADKYAPTIEGLLPGADSVGALQSQGKFPMAAFSSTPPTPAYAVYTPATTPAKFASVFAAGFGGDYLVNDSFRGAYLDDALAHPDGGFPVVTDDLPPADPTFPLRVHLKANDLRNWSPAAPTLLCGGSSDPTVFYFDTTLMQIYWEDHPPAVAPVVLDVDSASTADDPYASLKSGFAAAVALVRANAVLGGAGDGGDAAVLSAYHAGLVPPFCLSAVKSFFDAH